MGSQRLSTPGEPTCRSKRTPHITTNFSAYSHTMGPAVKFGFNIWKLRILSNKNVP